MDNTVIANKSRQVRLLLLAVLAIAVVQSSCTHEPVEVQPSTLVSLHEQPVNPNTVIRAAMMDRNQISMGEMGASRGSDAQVRQYSMLIFNDYTSAQNQLQGLCYDKGLPMQDEMSTEQFHTMQEMMNKDGLDFDLAFMDNQLMANDEVIEFLQAASLSPDEDLKEFALTLLPVAENHKMQTQAIIKHLNKARITVMNK